MIPARLRDTRGLTLVEMLVAAIVGLIVAAGALTFVIISSRATAEMRAWQILQQENAMITEMFTRSVREAESVCHYIDAATCTTSSDHIRCAHIALQQPGGGSVEFRINANELQMHDGAGWDNVSSRLCTSQAPSEFVIYPQGEGVRLRLTLETDYKGDTYTYTTTETNARCKN